METSFSFLGKQMEQLEIGSSYQRIQLNCLPLVGLCVAQVTTDHADGFDET
jgi:hypothetical protein